MERPQRIPAMFKSLNPDRVLGLFCIACALILIFLWIPFDVETGYVEKQRRSLTLGDSLAPTVAGVVILLGGLMLLFKADDNAQRLTRDNVYWLGILLFIVLVSMLLMRYAGPLVAMLSGEEYRPLRDTLPWKYIGFLLGGSTLIFTLMTLVDRRFSWLRLLLAVLATLLIALFYDLPFDDLVLPPNGDV